MVALAECFGAAPALTPTSGHWQGRGLDRSNQLRLLLAEAEVAFGPALQTLVQQQAQIDDGTPEDLAFLQEALQEAGRWRSSLSRCNERTCRQRSRPWLGPSRLKPCGRSGGASVAASGYGKTCNSAGPCPVRSRSTRPPGAGCASKQRHGRGSVRRKRSSRTWCGWQRRSSSPRSAAPGLSDGWSNGGDRAAQTGRAAWALPPGLTAPVLPLWSLRSSPTAASCCS